MAYCLPSSLANHESSQSWRELFGQLKRLGLFGSPKLGFWVALQEEYGPINSNVCWVHKTAKIPDKVPKLKGFELIPKVVNGVDSCIYSIDRKRGDGHHPPADCLANLARGPRGSKPFMVASAIRISTSFCTPVAHDTTMLVMGPGTVSSTGDFDAMWNFHTHAGLLPRSRRQQDCWCISVSTFVFSAWCCHGPHRCRPQCHLSK
jgi:hypothetical protein